MRERSTSGEGLPDDQLAIVSFSAVSDPVAEGGNDATLGSINNWAVTSSAEPKAVAFLAFMMNAENQCKAGQQQLFIPIAEGSSDGMDNPFHVQVAQNIANSSFHQIFLDQFLGASVGATINDISADLGPGRNHPGERRSAGPGGLGLLLIPPSLPK